MGYYIGYAISGLVIIVAIIVSLCAQNKVNSTFSKYREVPSSLNITGAELAERLSSVSDVPVSVRMCPGHLTDHYNSRDKSLNISQSNFDSRSVSAHAVVAHEFGHALQDAEGYVPLKVRQVVVTVSNFISGLLMPMLLVGILLQVFLFSPIGSIVIYASVGIYALSVIAGLVTLPVEFNASSRAKKLMYDIGCTSEDEVQGTDQVLNAAAMTYVASLFVSLAYFLRFLMLLLALRDD